MKIDTGPHDLCNAGSLIPSVVGSDQGWYFIRRIETHLGSCAVYEVRDNWRPKQGLVPGGIGKTFFTKACVQQIVFESQKRRVGKKAK
jgi:hypothetical protein